MDVWEKLVEICFSEFCMVAGDSPCGCDGCPYGKYGSENDECYTAYKKHKFEKLEKAGVTVQEWIPVTERCPNDADAGEKGLVLVYTKNSEHLIVGYNDVWKFREFVSYWMPLPQPPKGE